MNDTPTSGPMTRSRTHHALETTSSRHSLSRSHRKAGLGLGERKEYLFEVNVGYGCIARYRQRREFLNRAFAAYAPAAEQHEPIAEARGIADLMNREEQRPAAGRVRTQRRGNLATLPQVESLEGLVDEQRRLGREQADAEKRALALAFRERANGLAQQRAEI